MRTAARSRWQLLGHRSRPIARCSRPDPPRRRTPGMQARCTPDLRDRSSSPHRELVPGLRSASLAAHRDSCRCMRPAPPRRNSRPTPPCSTAHHQHRRTIDRPERRIQGHHAGCSSPLQVWASVREYGHTHIPRRSPPLPPPHRTDPTRQCSTLLQPGGRRHRHYTLPNRSWHRRESSNSHRQESASVSGPRRRGRPGPAPPRGR